MNETTKEAVRQLREIAATWRKYDTELTVRMAQIVETACEEAEKNAPSAGGVA